MTAVEYASLEKDGLQHELQAGRLLSEPRPFSRHVTWGTALMLIQAWASVP